MMAGNMLVAYWTADRDALASIFSNPGKFYGADPYTFLFASVLVLVFGAGLLSLDALLAKRYAPSDSSEIAGGGGSLKSERLGGRF